MANSEGAAGFSGPGLALSGPRRRAANGRAPEALVILLHGLGADGNDLIGLAPHWAPHLPSVEFVAPDAPFPCDMAQFGRQWFSVQDRSPAALMAGVRLAAQAVDGFIDAELARTGLPAGRLALVGFSQGTMMSLHVAPRRPAPVAGVLGYSGRLVGAGLLAREAVTKPPVMLIHGDADELVPFSAMAEAEAALRAAGIAATSEARPGLGHGIDPVGLRSGLGFLRTVLTAP